MLSTTLKAKKCRHCKSVFMPTRPMQVVCGGMCGLERARIKREAEAKKAKAAEAKKDRAAAEEAKTVTDLKAEAQKEVNSFVRARDHGLPCISCGKAWQPDFQAGHYRSRGAAGHLALDPRNIHGQCVQCNLHKHSNAVEYRIRLVERCGVALVEALECDNETVKLDRDTLRQLKTIYRAKARDLKKAQA
jgi:hypothetical protein